MSDRELNQVIADIRSEQVDEEVVRGAARRVYSRLFDTASHSETVERASVERISVERIKGCPDFQALMPAYLGRTLSPARSLLLEDHTSRCVGCRSVLRASESGSAKLLSPIAGRNRQRRPRPIPMAKWALAASLAIGVALGLTGWVNGYLPWQHSVRATVLSVEGRLFQVSDLGSSLIAVGSVITNAKDLRTAKGSSAILRLASGAQLEIGERSDVSVSRGWRGTTVNLENGRMIVQASETHPGVFYVAADDLVIPIRSAVLSVNRGTKGSRVAVAKGLARVEEGRQSFELRGGQQMSTSDRLSDVPIATEFAWSKNAGSYLALLGEFSTLQKQIESIAPSGPRYSSDLAKYVPEDSVIYAAIPNVGGAIEEAKRLFDDRLGQSEILRDWWTRQPAAEASHLDEIVNRIGSIGKYLGNEVVLSVSLSAAHRYRGAVILAEIREPGLKEYLEQNIPSTAGFRIVSDASTPSADANGQLLVSLSHNLLVATTDPVELRRVSEVIQNPGSGRFVRTPFFQRVQKSYGAGAGYLLAIDMEQIVPKSVDNASRQIPLGMKNVQYAVLERRDVQGRTETRAALSFAGSRQGIASWLAVPGSMGSLDFVSPDASFATSFALRNPRTLMEELIGSASKADSRFTQELNDFESHTGINLLDDLAAPLGSDVTFALDGPLLPVPAWKLALEVYDPARLQQTISTFVDRFNERPSGNRGKLLLKSQEVNSRTFYLLQVEDRPAMAVNYTFVDGYLLAGSSEADLLTAIQNRKSGHTLASSSSFRAQLPDDGYTNFSGIVYHNMAASLAPLAGQLKASGSLPPSQQQAVSALMENTAPGLICLYGEPDRIVVSSRGGFLGFDLATLANLQQGRSLLPTLASAGKAASPQIFAPPQQQRR